MLPKAHLTLDSRMSGSRWVITPSWLSGSWWFFFVYSSFRIKHEVGEITFGGPVLDGGGGNLDWWGRGRWPKLIALTSSWIPPSTWVPYWSSALYAFLLPAFPSSVRSPNCFCFLQNLWWPGWRPWGQHLKMFTEHLLCARQYLNPGHTKVVKNICPEGVKEMHNQAGYHTMLWCNEELSTGVMGALKNQNMKSSSWGLGRTLVLGGQRELGLCHLEWGEQSGDWTLNLSLSSVT